MTSGSATRYYWQPFPIETRRRAGAEEGHEQESAVQPRQRAGADHNRSGDITQLTDHFPSRGNDKQTISAG
jgi:hypothetical protein